MTDWGSIFKELSAIQRLIKTLLPRELMDGFEPVHDLPESRLNRRPIKPNKPKAPHVGHRDGQRSGVKSHSDQAPRRPRFNR